MSQGPRTIRLNVSDTFTFTATLSVFQSQVLILLIKNLSYMSSNNQSSTVLPLSIVTSIAMLSAFQSQI